MSSVFTFEPNKKFRPKIVRAMANHSNFVLIPKAAWTKDGVIDFTSANGQELGATVVPEKATLLARTARRGKGQKLTIDSVPSLDLLTFLHQHVASGDFLALKLDCEGCEYEVLERIQRLVPNLRELVSVLFMEWHAIKFKGTPWQESYARREMELKNWLAYSGVSMVDSSWDAYRWARLHKTTAVPTTPSKPAMGDHESLKTSQKAFAAALESWRVAHNDGDGMNGPRGSDSTPQRATGDTCLALIREPLRAEYRSAYFRLDKVQRRVIDTSARYNIRVGSQVQLHEAALEGDPTYCSRLGFCACAFSPPLLTLPKNHIDKKCGERMWIDHVTHNARMQRLVGGSGSVKAATLATNGYVWMRAFLSPATLGALSASLSSDNRAGRRGMYYSAHKLFMHPNLRKEILFNEQVNELVRDYLGHNVRVDDAYLVRTKRNAQWNNAAALGNTSGTALYHHDAVGHRLKLFIYLTDVEPLQATPIARGSHRMFYHAGYSRDGH